MLLKCFIYCTTKLNRILCVCVQRGGGLLFKSLPAEVTHAYSCFPPLCLCWASHPSNEAVIAGKTRLFVLLHIPLTAGVLICLQWCWETHLQTLTPETSPRSLDSAFISLLLPARVIVPHECQTAASVWFVALSFVLKDHNNYVMEMTDAVWSEMLIKGGKMPPKCLRMKRCDLNT